VAGFDGAGVLAAAARAQLGQAIDEVLVDTAGFRFGAVLDLQGPNFLPGGAKYGDLPALLALGAPGRVWVGGESRESLTVVENQYRKLQAETAFTLYAGDARQTRVAAVDWLLAREKN
jgi:hypothetical protein